MTNDARILTLKCPSCGSNLEISADMDTFACGYCGTQQMVLRRGGTVSLKLVGEAIARVQVGTDRTAAELAIVRLRAELADIERKMEALAPTFIGPRSGASVSESAGHLMGGVLARWIWRKKEAEIEKEEAEITRRLLARATVVQAEIAEHLAFLNKQQ